MKSTILQLYVDEMHDQTQIEAHEGSGGNSGEIASTHIQSGNITTTVAQLRKNFPERVTLETKNKFTIALNNKSYVISALQFIGVIYENGKKTE
jgi:hypothetical protein